MATTGNIFVYWMDGIGGRAFDHHSRNGRGGEGVICQQKMPAGPGISPSFSNAWGLPRGMLAAGIDSHIRYTQLEHSLVIREPKCFMFLQSHEYQLE